MARLSPIQISALVSLCSLFYVSHSLKQHSLTERPRLSSFLLLLLSSAICYAASYFSQWFPGSDDRFTSTPREGRVGLLMDYEQDDPLPNGASKHLPNRPRRWFVVAAVLSVMMRLEVFELVNSRQQCAAPGAQCFLCLLLIGYDMFANRRKFGFPLTGNMDDPWRTMFDDLRDWFSGHNPTMVLALISASVFSLGTFLSVGNILRSSYFCFDAVDSQLQTAFLQFVGLVLDAATIVLFWRILAWTRTTKARLRTLATLLFYSSLSILTLWLGIGLLGGSLRGHSGFGLLYSFDILVDSIGFAILLISAMFWVCEASPVAPSAITTFLVGIGQACVEVFRAGNWLHYSRPMNLGLLWLTVAGTVLFMYLHDLRTVIFVRRTLFTALLVLLLLAASINTVIRGRPTIHTRHPANNLIYNAYSDHDQWLKHVRASNLINTAVREYKERHNGRVPPPNFADWFEYAEDSVIIDEFTQIERDLEPFWRLSPETLRKRVDIAVDLPHVATIMVKHGDVSVGGVQDEEKQGDLNEVAKMIRKFAKRLPDMVLPINLETAPRILPSWDTIHSRTHADLSSFADLLSRRSLAESNSTAVENSEVRRGDETPGTPSLSSTSTRDFREMLYEACPPGSQMKMSRQWDVQDFCWPCVKGHSNGHFLSSFDKSLDICSQPDLKYLHSFAMTEPQSPPIRNLLPLFGPSKMDAFSDIILPIPQSRLDKPDISWPFDRRFDTLFWQGSADPYATSTQGLHGSQKLRLLHLVNKPNPSDRVTILLQLPHAEDKFAYENVLAAEASNVLPFNVGMKDYSACKGPYCDLIEKTYGTLTEVKDALEYRYVMLLDEDDGPPRGFFRALQSGSVPFLSTLFRTWYTDRLMPWLHFVPIDIRFQALHSTYAYFTGTGNRVNIDGHKSPMEGSEKDAQWIANQGKNWAAKALRPKDMEIYLFRLLLEWGRLIDDRRDEIGFRINEKGDVENSIWTSQKTAR